MTKTIWDLVEHRKTFTAQHGYDIEILSKLHFIVTDKGIPMILQFETKDLNQFPKIMSMYNITPAVSYSGDGTGIATGFQTWNGTDNGIFEKYCSDARINKTGDQCVAAIIADCQNTITRIVEIELVGVQEAAEILGWDKRKIATYMSRGSFPTPVKKLASGSIWTKKQIQDYKDSHS